MTRRALNARRGRGRSRYGPPELEEQWTPRHPNPNLENPSSLRGVKAALVSALVYVSAYGYQLGAAAVLNIPRELIGVGVAAGGDSSPVR